MKPNHAINDINIGPAQFFLSNSLVSKNTGNTLISPKGAMKPIRVTQPPISAILTNE